jgi:glycosyltransferase involved in cell wall biosynthesis
LKLIIQIPCYNEAQTLPITLKDLPKQIDGIDIIETLIIDDGSTDDTVKIAKQYGVNHIVRHTKNFGLAKAFMTGIHSSLSFGADIIVNTDADNQYNGEDIKKLVEPILKGQTEIVVGARPINNIESFSAIKKVLQKIGSWAVRLLSGTNIPDAPSGFRAFSRDAAFQLNVFNKYTYTLETLIQAGIKDIPIVSVPIRVNKELRPSKLIKSIPRYINRSVITIMRIFIIYKPLRFFGFISLLSILLGFILGVRYLYFFSIGNGSGHIQSLIIMMVLLILGFLLMVIGFLGDAISVNRKILEDIQHNMRKISTDKRDNFC